MATGAASASLMGLKTIDSGLGFAKASDFVKVSDLKRVKFQRTKISVIKNSNPGLDISELRPASEGSPLLGTYFSNLLLFLMIKSKKYLSLFLVFGSSGTEVLRIHS